MGQEADERYLHASQSSQRIPGSVRNVDPGAVSTHEDEHEYVQGNEIGDEDVSSPSRHHVSIK